MEEEADGLPVHEELPGDVAGAADDEEGDAGDAPASESFMPEHEPHVQGSALHACQDARRENKRGRDGGPCSARCAGTFSCDHGR